VTATATTTIQGVSVLSRQKKRGTDRFELALSPTGIEVRRPDRPVQQLGWDRVSEWEIEERKGYVLLTLRGRGATTPLVVPGWSLDDLELLMREITADSAASAHNGAGPVVTKPNVAAAAAAATASAAPTTTRPAPAQPATKPAPAEAAPPSRSERRQKAPRPPRKRRQFQLGWKPVVAVVLLGVLAAAIALVLLQSAGVINWSFLGPVA
jgi:hypothetical protein